MKGVSIMKVEDMVSSRLLKKRNPIDLKIRPGQAKISSK